MRANQVYQDYISDRHHTHMNATQVGVELFVDYRESLVLITNESIFHCYLYLIIRYLTIIPLYVLFYILLQYDLINAKHVFFLF